MSREPKTSLLIVEEQDLLRQGLETVFKAQQEFDVVGCVADPAQAVQQISDLKPQIIVLGLREMASGADICATLAKENPEAKILLLAPPGSEQEVVRAFKQGASGCLLTDVMADDLLQTIRMVAKGQMVVPQTMAKKGLLERRKRRRNAPSISIRELEVLQLMANGLRNKEIARELFISEVTVKTHVSRIFRKLGQTSRTGAIQHGHKNGWIRISP